MRIGKRRVLAATYLVAIALAASAAWFLGGTDGLVAVVAAATLIAIAALGWLVIRLERNLVRLISETRTSLGAAIVATTETGDQAEQLLRAVHSGFARSEHTLDTMVTELAQARQRTDAAIERLASLKDEWERKT